MNLNNSRYLTKILGLDREKHAKKQDKKKQEKR